MIIHIICGSRETTRDEDVIIWNCLDELAPAIIAHGDCLTGVDRHADIWARRRAVPRLLMSPDWVTGHSGGPIRNRRLRDLCCALFDDQVLCVAFPGGKGTASMVALCREKRLPVMEIKYHPLEICSVSNRVELSDG